MKQLTTLLLAAVLVIGSAHGQERISESDIVGDWKMVIEMDGVMEELDEEADDTDNLLAKVLIKSVSGIVEGVMDNLEIYMKFKRGGDVNVNVDAFGSDTDTDEAEWTIKGNRLYIEDMDKDNLNWESDDDDYWVMRDGVLFLEMDKDDQDVKVYMVRIDD